MKNNYYISCGFISFSADRIKEVDGMTYFYMKDEIVVAHHTDRMKLVYNFEKEGVEFYYMYER